MFTHSEQKRDHLADLTILGPLPTRERRRLARHVDEVAVDAGEVLIVQGSLNRHTYFVVEGLLGVEIDGELIATVGPDGIVGERTALSDAHLANATVRTLEPSVVLAMNHRALRGLARSHAVVGEHLHAIIEDRSAA